MILCEFFVAGDPVAQPRIRPRMTHAGRLTVHMPSTAQAWRERVGIAGHNAYRRAARLDALEVDLHFCLRRPAGHLTTNGALKAAAPAFPIARPDIDNLVKSTLDALNGTIWRDDSQVVGVRTSKSYAGADALSVEPGCHITVRSMP